MRIGRERLKVHEFGPLWEKRRGVLTVEIVDILVGVGRDDGFWCLSGQGEQMAKSRIQIGSLVEFGVVEVGYCNSWSHVKKMIMTNHDQRSSISIRPTSHWYA